MILDICCGSRMFYFQKDSDDVIFLDFRQEKMELCDGRQLSVKPDIVSNFRKLPFGEGQFDMVVFDPPHLMKAGPKSYMRLKYGVLGRNWKDDLKEGFNEGWRVLRPGGSLVFKWNETHIKIAEILKLFPVKPIFGQRTTRNLKTHWVVFYKSSV